MGSSSVRIRLKFIAACLLAAIGLTSCRLMSSEKTVHGSSPMVERTVDVGGVKRSYLLYTPEIIRNTPAVPVVLVFHGGLGRPETMPEGTGFNNLADQEGFAVVYPRGTTRVENLEMDTWNGGLCCGWAQKNNVDDVGFVRALLDDLESVISVDPHRIYATGLSNGAILSYRLACVMADRIAAIGPVAGTQNIAACNPSQPVSVIHFPGTADPMVPLEGGYGEGVSGFFFAPVSETIEFWVQADGCTAAADPEQTGPVLHEMHSVCADGTAVELYLIDGGTHSWPGGNRFGAGADEPSPSIDATAVMWEFFQAHPKP